MKLLMVHSLLIIITHSTTRTETTHISKREERQNIFGSFARRLEKIIDGYRDIVSENFSDENLEKKNEHALAAGGKLRNQDWRLPHLTKTSPRRQLYRNKTFIETLPLFWSMFKSVVHHYDNNRHVQELVKKYHKLQEVVPPYVQFPCSVYGARSKVRPTSVDRVRPGDIDMVAVLGDSLIAGTGLAGVHALQILYANAGLSWGIGGLENWRKFLTLPNILKEFNPNLIGFATKDTLWNGRYEIGDYNLAVPSATDDDLLTMAKTFVAKAKRDPRVNFKQDWKMISVFQGGNNICSDYCYWKNPSDTVVHHKKVIEEALDYLSANSPRTIVNFVTIPNFIKVVSSEVDKSEYCTSTQKFMCPCLFGNAFTNNFEKYVKLIDKIVQAQRDAANNPKYQQKADFAVLEQPVLVNVTNLNMLETKYGPTTDYRLLAPDCIHFSQRLAALLANGVWNSLLRPYGSKPFSANFTLFQTFDCPSEARPYIATHNN